MKNKFKNAKGITLVALVITIIILLILAGISIQALTNTGLFANAKKASDASKLSDAKEKITLLEHEWQMEHASSPEKTLEEFLNDKVTDKTIDEFKKLDDGNYEVYINGYVGTLNSDGSLVGDVQKAGPRPTISNIKITTDGSKEVADNSQKTGAKLQINFSTSMENGTIKSVTPAVPYTTNGTETEVTFTVVGTVDGTDYTTTRKISIASKYRVAEKVSAAKIVSNPSKYYGEHVSYTSANGVTGWKIFYAEGDNIYLITDDYVDRNKLPNGTKEDGTATTNKPNITGSSNPKAAFFTNILNDYSTGSARVTSDVIKNLNKSFFVDKKFTSTNDNMKAVAYMLDTTAWSSFKDKEGKASYAIGGPTIEMLFKSYNQKHPGKNYEAQASSATGYQIKVNGGDWKNYMTSSSEYLDENDTLYVLPSSNGANAMWLASPSAINTPYVMIVNSNGGVRYYAYATTGIGLRPLVCLQSEVQLQ